MKELTGAFRFRNKGELLVLQVEEISYESMYMDTQDKRIWRDAQTEDLLNVEFCPRRNWPMPELRQVPNND